MEVAEETNMREDEVLACSFSAWYDRFRHITFKSEIISLPQAFVDFLGTDGLRVPRCEDDAASADSWGDGDSNESDPPPRFPELEKEIASIISRLGGNVLPKLNWSAPKDATWLQPSLQCQKPHEVFLLLKGSDFIAHDLNHSFDHCSTERKRPDTFTLVLRKWYDLHESNEFRCFVSDNSLFAVSQRQTACFYEHLVQPNEIDSIREEILSFFQGHIQGQFPLSRYVFDVYVGGAPRRKVRLVDFSPWGPTTEPALFDWRELEEMVTNIRSRGEKPDDTSAPRFEFRVVRSETETRATKVERYSQLPLELAQLGTGEGMEELLKKADKLLAEKSGDAHDNKGNDPA